MKKIFICATPFHVFNIINLLSCDEFKTEDIDVILLDSIVNMEIIREKLTEIGIFNNVYQFTGSVCNYSVHGLKLAKNYMLHLLRVKAFIKKKLKQTSYQELYMSCPDIILNSCLYKHVKKHYPSVRLYYLEDGIGTYIRSIEMFPSKANFFFGLIGVNGIEKKVERFLFYAPDIVQISDIKKGKLPIPNELAKERSNLVFSYNEQQRCLNKRVILFEESFSQDGIEVNDKELFEIVVDKIGRNNCSLKRHPRSKSKKLESLNIDILQTVAPWEIFCMNQNMENLILVALSSTALLTPKVIFGQEPRVILLYKLLEHKTGYHSEILEKHIFNVKKTYKSSGFYIPETIEELESILERI